MHNCYLFASLLSAFSEEEIAKMLSELMALAATSAPQNPV